MKILSEIDMFVFFLNRQIIILPLDFRAVVVYIGEGNRMVTTDQIFY